MRFSYGDERIVTDKISHFVTQTAVEDIPSDALRTAQLGIIDFIGVALAGSGEEPSKIIIDYARKMGSLPKASVIGSDFKTSPYLAALVNGTVGHVLDYDDIAVSLAGHPSAFLAPAILAVGESIGASGEDILAAYVVGYETVNCIAGPVLQSHCVRGWHSTATFGTLGAAAATAWLLRLNACQVRMSLGIAASLAGGLRQNFGTMTKPLHAGKAAANGIQAALLARAGFTADDSIIEAPLGFAKVFGHDREVDWVKASEGLGETFLITSPIVGLSIKTYPSCGLTHYAIDAALHIKEEHKLNAADIVEVKLGVSPFDKQVLIYHQPRTGLQGKFSLEYCVARALLSGEVRLRHLNDEAVTELQVKSLMGKMKWVEKYPMPVIGATGGFCTKSVTVKLKDGREFSKEVAITKGMPQKPLTSGEFDSKYRDCASTVLCKEDVEKSLSILTNLRGVKNIKEVVEIITGIALS